MTDLAELEAHIAELCARHGIERNPLPGPLGRMPCAIHETGEIWIRPIRSALSYVMALHEIGHIVGRHQGSPLRRIRETYAWRWARSAALVWTPQVERYVANAEAFWRPVKGVSRRREIAFDARWQEGMRSVLRRAREQC